MKRGVFCYCVILLLVFAFLTAGCQRGLSCEYIEAIYNDNRSLFGEAADAIMSTQCGDNLSIQKDKPDSEKLTVFQVNDLYFSTFDCQVSESDFVELYYIVEPLFSDVGIRVISYNSYQIQFMIHLDNGYESSIIYSFAGKEPSASFPDVQKIKMLNTNWYAVVARD